MSSMWRTVITNGFNLSGPTIRIYLNKLLYINEVQYH